MTTKLIDPVVMVANANARARDLNSSAPKPVVNQTPAPGLQRYLPDDSALRKTFPVTEGVLDYFPDAIAAVAEISFKGNEKHNPGQPLHHNRSKSMDHAGCIGRHLIERGGFDGQGNRHSAQLAWRALALLQEELEREYHLATPRGATELPER